MADSFRYPIGSIVHLGDVLPWCRYMNTRGPATVIAVHNVKPSMSAAWRQLYRCVYEVKTFEGHTMRAYDIEIVGFLCQEREQVIP